ncbi:MAG: DUF5916 domain-containing protein [Bacteroidota bacterium]|nr:DUF5916 domain-containing protein [Bacteroidota bacterium]
MRNFISFIILLILSYFSLTANDSLNMAIQAQFIEEYIKIDGNLNKDVWQNRPKINSFTQRELKQGEAATEKTEVSVLYNKEFLYIGIWCYDSNPNEIIAKELKRDFKYDLDDNIIVILDTYNDKRNGFMFVTNPNGARCDVQIFNNGGTSNTFWNGVWNVKTIKNELGWFAEFEIPFYTLKYRTNIQEQIWGINIERNIRRKREQVRWKGWNRNNRIEQVNQAGQLLGLNQLGNKQFTELKPYAIGGAEQTPNNNRLVRNIGGDLNYLITPTYRINLTVNTDFAQVEADQQQVNLTRFPLFFPELREFFLEGDDYFNFSFGGNRIVPLYTRKIGLNEARETVPIIAGLRILGKENNRTLGLMSLQTAETPSQASTNYTTASWRQDIGKQSVVGIISSNKFVNGNFHSTTGINGRYSTSKFLKDKNLDIGGAYIQTYNNDTGWKQNAYAYRAFIQYQNDILSIFASSQQSPSDFIPEIGLMRRTNFRESFANINLRPRPKKWLKWIRQFDFVPAGLTFTQYNDTRDIQSFEYQLRYFGFDTKKGEKIGLDYRILTEGLIRDFEIYENIIIPDSTYTWQQMEAEISTFSGRTLSMYGKLIKGGFYNGKSLQTNVEVLWRTNKYLNILFRHARNEVNLPYGNFTTDLIGTRIEYAFNPNVFGSVLSQWSSLQDEFSFNFRLQIIPKIGTDFYLIVNQIYDTQNNRFDHSRGTILGKLIWRFVL